MRYRNRTIAITAGFAMICTLECSDAVSPAAPGSHNQKGTASACVSNRVYFDGPGDGGTADTDFDQVSLVPRDNEVVSVAFEFVELSSEVLVGTSESAFAEYFWSAFIDVDASTATGVQGHPIWTGAEFELAVSHFDFVGTPRFMRIDEMQADVWRYDERSRIWQVIDAAEVNIFFGAAGLNDVLRIRGTIPGFLPDTSRYIPAVGYLNPDTLQYTIDTIQECIQSESVLLFRNGFE